MLANRNKHCPYKNTNRLALSINDKRYDNGYTCEYYIDEWVVTWNSYARFAGDVIDFQNNTAYDVLELSCLVNEAAVVVENLRLRSIEFARNLHVAEVRRTSELASLSFEVRMG